MILEAVRFASYLTAQAVHSTQLAHVVVQDGHRCRLPAAGQLRLQAMAHQLARDRVQALGAGSGARADHALEIT